MRREMVLTLKDVLDMAETLSRAGHPDDFIDGETSRIRLESSMTGPPRVVITWEGPPPYDPDYDR